MLSRRQTVRALGAVGIAAPALTACGASGSGGGAESGRAGLRLVKADVAASAGDPAAAHGVAEAMRAFTLDLWGTLGAASDNRAVSPYSIAVALAMTANGAAGETATKMLTTLHIDSLATYNAGTAALTQALTGLAGPVTVDGKSQEIELAPANQLFGERSTTWKQPFLTVLAKMYGAGMRTVDFVHAPEQARALVNAWTSAETHGRIPEILPPGVIDDLTRLVLVNALYFKAPWETPFEVARTSPGRFHIADGSSVTAQLMTSTEGLAYVEGPHFRGSRLTYAGGKLAMTVALPEPDSEAAALREVLEQGVLSSGTPGLLLTMPRWTYRVATDLRAPLTSLGMGVAFGNDADFREMTDQSRLMIGAALHQAYVAVDEAGTEAAAATAVEMQQSSGFLPSQTLVLDRPFLYVVHDTAHGTPLFVGRVANPAG